MRIASLLILFAACAAPQGDICEMAVAHVQSCTAETVELRSCGPAEEAEAQALLSTTCEELDEQNKTLLDDLAPGEVELGGICDHLEGCRQGLTCIHGYCAPPGEEGDSCDGTASSVPGWTTAALGDDSDCASGLQCIRDPDGTGAHCRTSCWSDSDCPSGKECVGILKWRCE